MLDFLFSWLPDSLAVIFLGSLGLSVVTTLYHFLRG